MAFELDVRSDTAGFACCLFDRWPTLAKLTSLSLGFSTRKVRLCLPFRIKSKSEDDCKVPGIVSGTHWKLPKYLSFIYPSSRLWNHAVWERGRSKMVCIWYAILGYP